MELNLNMQATSSIQMFGLQEDRAVEISEKMSSVCYNAYLEFPNGYIVENKDGFRLNISQVLKEMLDLANNDNERAFVLYSAHGAITIVLNQIDKDYVNIILPTL